MNNIHYVSPKTLEEALLYLSENPGVRVLAGGTDLVAKWKKSGFPDMSLMDIRNIKDFDSISETPEGIFIGAGATMAKVRYSETILSHFPILAEAAGKVGSVQVRNMATIGGNSCNAAPSADTVLPLLVYNAEAVIASKDNERRCPLCEFFLAPGKTVLEHGELLKGFFVPFCSKGVKTAFVKHSRRVGMDLATVGIAVKLNFNDAKEITEIAIALGAVGPRPISVCGLEKYIGKKLSKELILDISKEAAAEASPITDVRGSKEYRSDMLVENIRESISKISGAAY